MAGSQVLSLGKGAVPITPHLEIPAGSKEAGMPNHLSAAWLAAPGLTHPPDCLPTLKANSGRAGNSQAFSVASFTGKHCALGHP